MTKSMVSKSQSWPIMLIDGLEKVTAMLNVKLNLGK